MGRAMTLQRVYLCTCFYCVNVIIISNSRQRMKKVVESLPSPTSPSASLSNKHIHRLDTIQQKSLLNSPGPFFKHMITTVDLSLAFSFFVMLIARFSLSFPILIKEGRHLVKRLLSRRQRSHPLRLMRTPLPSPSLPPVSLSLPPFSSSAVTSCAQAPIDKWMSASIQLARGCLALLSPEEK